MKQSNFFNSIFHHVDQFFFIENVKGDWKGIAPDEDCVRKTEY